MWSDWLVFCDCSFSLSALWCPLSLPTILLGFLLLWTWGISSRLLQQSVVIAPDLWCGAPPLRHSCTVQPPLLPSFDLVDIICQVNLLYFFFVGLFWFCLWVYMYMCIFSHTFYCCYKPLPLCSAFAVLWSFPFFFFLSIYSSLFFFSLFYNFNI